MNLVDNSDYYLSTGALIRNYSISNFQNTIKLGTNHLVIDNTTLPVVNAFLDKVATSLFRQLASKKINNLNMGSWVEEFDGLTFEVILDKSRQLIELIRNVEDLYFKDVSEVVDGINNKIAAEIGTRHNVRELVERIVRDIIVTMAEESRTDTDQTTHVEQEGTKASDRARETTTQDLTDKTRRTVTDITRDDDTTSTQRVVGDTTNNQTGSRNTRTDRGLNTDTRNQQTTNTTNNSSDTTTFWDNPQAQGLVNVAGTNRTDNVGTFTGAVVTSGTTSLETSEDIIVGENTTNNVIGNQITNTTGDTSLLSEINTTTNENANIIRGVEVNEGETIDVDTTNTSETNMELGTDQTTDRLTTTNDVTDKTGTITDNERTTRDNEEELITNLITDRYRYDIQNRMATMMKTFEVRLIREIKTELLTLFLPEFDTLLFD